MTETRGNRARQVGSPRLIHRPRTGNGQAGGKRLEGATQKFNARTATPESGKRSGRAGGVVLRSAHFQHFLFLAESLLPQPHLKGELAECNASRLAYVG